jgi:hypothetical protein
VQKGDRGSDTGNNDKYVVQHEVQSMFASGMRKHTPLYANQGMESVT